MKTALLVVLFALCASAAHAQLDQILAPLPAAAAVSRWDHSSSQTQNAQPDLAAIAEAPDTHRNLTSDDVLSEIQKQLISYFGIKGDLKLSFLRDWRTLVLPQKDFTLTLTDYPAEGVTSSFGLRFKIECGGVAVGEWQTALRAQLWQTVWVTQGRLDRGQSLDRSQLNSQKVDVLRSKETLITEDVDPSGYDVAQGLGPGQALSKQNVTERPLIHKGDVVEVVAIQGTLDIHMKALALEDGGMRALIKMRNLDSSKDFTAQIKNENEVEVHF